MQRRETLWKKALGSMQKFALLVLFLVHLIIIFLLLGFSVLVAAGLCSTAGWQEVPASFNCPEIPARLETLDNRKQIWSLTQTYPSKDLFINWGTVLWASETLPEPGGCGANAAELSQCLHTTPHASFPFRRVSSHSSHRPELAMCIWTELKVPLENAECSKDLMVNQSY